MKNTKVKTKWRLEYWIDGRKNVRVFGSRGQADQFVKNVGSSCHRADIRPFQRLEMVVGQ